MDSHIQHRRRDLLKATTVNFRNASESRSSNVRSQIRRQEPYGAEGDRSVMSANPLAPADLQRQMPLTIPCAAFPKGKTKTFLRDVPAGNAAGYLIVRTRCSTSSR